MCSSSAPMLTRSHSSFWTASNRSSSISKPSKSHGSQFDGTVVQSSPEQGRSKKQFHDSPMSNDSAPSHKHALPGEPQVQSATRLVANIDPSITAPFLNAQRSSSHANKLNHYIAVIHSLQDPFLDRLTIVDSITPADFNSIVSLSSEYKKYHLSTKLVYRPHTQQIIAMVPYEIHECAIRHFEARITRALLMYDLDEDSHVAFELHLNTAIRKGDKVLIPDFHLDVRPRSRVSLPSIPFWIGECGFSSSRNQMVARFKSVAAIVPEMDVALMICIRDKKTKLPPTSHPLHSSPELPRAAFTPSDAPTNYIEPVVVEDIKWISIKSITVNVFLRGSDGKFDFENTGKLYAVGSLYPAVQMSSVDDMLDTAMKRLLLKAIRLMESAGSDTTSATVSRLRTASATASFPVKWQSLLENLQCSLYDTAFSRYHSWRHRESKQKTANDTQSAKDPSEKRTLVDDRLSAITGPSKRMNKGRK